MDISKLKVVALAASLALAACASDSGLRTEEKRALYQSHAGEPVSSFRYFGSINGWTPLGDSALVVWTRPSEACLLDLQGPCHGLAPSPARGLTSQMRGVHARCDSLLVRGGGSLGMSRRIRPR